MSSSTGKIIYRMTKRVRAGKELPGSSFMLKVESYIPRALSVWTGDVPQTQYAQRKTKKLWGVANKLQDLMNKD